MVEGSRIPFPGTDSLDRSYWWLDMGHPLGFRLYRHSPQTGRCDAYTPRENITSSSGGLPAQIACRRGNKLQTWDPPGTWELMASTLEELQVSKPQGALACCFAHVSLSYMGMLPIPNSCDLWRFACWPIAQGVGGPLSRSQKKADKQLVAELDSVLVELTAKIEAEERMRRVGCRAAPATLNVSSAVHGSNAGASLLQARSRLRLDVGIILDGGCGTRARRARKEVNYTFNDFDEMIGEAIRSYRCIGIGWTPWLLGSSLLFA